MNFRHDLQELCGELDDLVLSDVCEVDEIYVTAGEKEIKKEDESPRSRGLKRTSVTTGGLSTVADQSVSLDQEAASPLKKRATTVAGE